MAAQKGYGVRNAYGDLKRVLMHRPGPELNLVTPQTLREFNFDAPVDPERFIDDYETMRGLFHTHGVETVLLTEVLANDADAISFINRRPNMTYTRDLAAVFQSGAVLMGPHLKGRWGDQRMMGRAFQKLGVPVLGHCMRSFAIARFSWAFHLTQDSGMPIDDSLEASLKATSNGAFHPALRSDPLHSSSRSRKRRAAFRSDISAFSLAS